MSRAVAVPLAQLRMRTRQNPFMRARHKNILIFLLGLIVALEFSENAMFVFGASHIMGGIDAAPEEFVRAQAAYAVGSMLSIVLQQRLSQRWGYRRYLLGAIALFMVGLWGCAHSSGIDQMSVARLIQGAGGGVFFTSCRVLILQMFALPDRPKATRGFMMCMFGASALGPAFAAWVIDTWGWAMVFYSVMPATVLAWIGVWLLIPSGVGRVPGRKLTGSLPARMTLVPLAWFILAVVCLQLAVSEARLDVLAHPLRLTMLIAAGVLLLAGFLWQQWRHPQPLLSLRMFNNPAYWVGLLLYVVHYGFANFGAYLFPVFAQQGLGMPLRTTGWLNSFAALITLATAFTYSRFLSARLKRKRPVMLLGVACLILGALWFAAMPADAAPGNLIAGLIAKGIFGALLVLPVACLTFRDLGDQRFSHGYQGKNLMRQIVSSAASSVAAVVLQSHYYALQEKLTGQLDPARADVAQWSERIGSWFAAQGLAPGQAHTAALATLQQLVNTQAMLLACQDLYRWMAVAALGAAVIIIVQKKLP
jgi:predicted MFS family arabinose efflux permease